MAKQLLTSLRLIARMNFSLKSYSCELLNLTGTVGKVELMSTFTARKHMLNDPSDYMETRLKLCTQMTNSGSKKACQLFRSRNCFESSIPSVNRSPIRNTFCDVPFHYRVQCEHSHICVVFFKKGESNFIISCVVPSFNE